MMLRRVLGSEIDDNTLRKGLKPKYHPKVITLDAPKVKMFKSIKTTIYT